MGPKPKSTRELFMRRVSISKYGCWLWPLNSLNRSGYGQFGKRHNGIRYRRLAHRLSYELFIGQIPDGMQVMHSCDVKRCVNPKHLSLGTQQTNEDDKVSKGRSNKGEDRWSATINNGVAQQLLNDYRSGSKIPDLAKRYKTTYGIAYSICKRSRWKHLK